jgi:hypothetical protein
MEDATFCTFALVPIHVLPFFLLLLGLYQFLTIVTPTVLVVALVWLDLSMVVAASVSARMDTMVTLAPHV